MPLFTNDRGSMAVYLLFFIMIAGGVFMFIAAGFMTDLAVDAVNSYTGPVTQERLDVINFHANIGLKYAPIALILVGVLGAFVYASATKNQAV